MKIKLTPLNIVTSFCLVSAAYLLVFQDSEGWRKLGTIPLLIFGVISFIADTIFRTFVKELKRVWIVELAFIIFAAILTLLIQRI